MWSFWETKSFKKYDYLIIGAGITGLSVAASLKEQYPKAKVAVVERGFLPTGASTKNAGFACFGSLTEIATDLQKMTDTQVVSLVSERLGGLEKLRERLGDKAIGYHNYGGYEIIMDKQAPYLEQLKSINELLAPVFGGQQVFKTKDGLIGGFGFNSRFVRRIIYNRFEGQIDTGKMMKSLLNYVQKKGVRIFTGSEVIAFEDNGEQVQVQIKNPLADHLPHELVAKKVAICTNAFTKTLLPEVELKAGRGQVLVTKPLENLRFKGVFHLDEGYYYFRNFNKRIIFGGGRNLDFEGETTTELETTSLILNDLKQKLKEIIIPNQPFEIEQTWAGIMAFGEDKQPILTNYSSNVVLGVRLGGMGVALGSKLGEKIAEKMS